MKLRSEETVEATVQFAERPWPAPEALEDVYA